MEEKYINNIEDFIDEKKNLLKCISTTFYIYNYSKIKGNKEYNAKLANNIKKFFLSISLYIATLISIFNLDSQNSMKENSNLLDFIYIIIGIIFLIIIYNKTLLNNYGIEVKKYRDNGKEKLSNYVYNTLFSMRLVYILDLCMIIYIIILESGFIYNTPKTLKIIALMLVVYLF